LPIETLRASALNQQSEINNQQSARQIPSKFIPATLT
jgi:hypothetical protein